MIHLAKTNPFFRTSTFKCFFFFNQFITDCEIFPIFNSLLICKCVERPTIGMTNKNAQYLLQLQLRPCYYLNLMATRSISGQNIVGF
jgi:hypothetical protein